MKSSLSDLNEYLFDALNNISNEDLNGEDLDREIKRSEAITRISKTIIENGELALKVKMHLDDYGLGENYKLDLLESKNE